jgi:hypothetical protein
MRRTISQRELIVQELVKTIAVLEDANTKVYRNLDKPLKVSTGGMIILRDNEAAKEVDTLLNPLSYTYELTIQLEVMVQHQDVGARSRVLDLLLSLLEGVIIGNCTLNGLAEYVEAKPAEFQDEPIEGAATIRVATVPVIVRYSHDIAKQKAAGH